MSKPKTFSETAEELTAKYMRELCQQCPELRSAVVIFDWEELLNQVATPFLWASNRERHGDITTGNLSVLNGMSVQLPKFVATHSEMVRKSIMQLAQHADQLQALISKDEDEKDKIAGAALRQDSEGADQTREKRTQTEEDNQTV